MALCRALRLLAFYALTRFRACNSTAANYTIDDLKGDVRTGVLPVYEPLSMWNAVVDGNCNVCVIHPDPKKAVEGTWHDATQTGKTPPTVTIQFTGTAIYMFGIVPNNIPRAATHVNLTFTLDSVPQTGYAHTPDNSSNMAYAVPIFATSGLTNGSHTLVARTTNAPALFIFDYALYTLDGGHETHPQVRTAAIVAGTLGGLLAAGLLLLLALLFVRRRRRRQRAPAIDPYSAHLFRAASPQNSSVYYLPPYTEQDPNSLPMALPGDRKHGGIK